MMMISVCDRGRRDLRAPCAKQLEDGGDCPDRRVGCHGTCERYAAWKAERAAARKVDAEYRAYESNHQRTVGKQNTEYIQTRYGV